MLIQKRRRLNPKNRVHIELAIEDKRVIVLKQIEDAKIRERHQRVILESLAEPYDPSRWAIPEDLHYPTSEKWKKAGLFGLLTQFLP